MQKKIDIYDLDIPNDDFECWEKYPKHHWVYELSRLLDAQNIKWSPFKTSQYNHEENNLYLESKDNYISQPGIIFIKNIEGIGVISEVYIIKGEIKHIRQFDNINFNEFENLIGEIELRINAFVTLHFRKFTGVISVDTYANEIFRIRLRPFNNPELESNIDIVKLLRRIYKKAESNLINTNTISKDFEFQ